jgi:hypothetical protein
MGCGAKIIVFSLLKHDDNAYSEIALNITKATLLAVICGHSDLESAIHADG